MVACLSNVCGQLIGPAHMDQSIKAAHIAAERKATQPVYSLEEDPWLIACTGLINSNAAHAVHADAVHAESVVAVGSDKEFFSSCPDMPDYVTDPAYVQAPDCLQEASTIGMMADNQGVMELENEDM